MLRKLKISSSRFATCLQHTIDVNATSAVITRLKGQSPDSTKNQVAGDVEDHSCVMSFVALRQIKRRHLGGGLLTVVMFGLFDLGCTA